MSIYIILSYDIEDPQGYVPGVVHLLQKHNSEILVADYEAKSIEGKARGVNAVLRFESEEAVMNFYNDPDYEPLKKFGSIPQKTELYFLLNSLFHHRDNFTGGGLTGGCSETTRVSSASVSPHRTANMFLLC